MKIALLDHPFHRRTRSLDFFTNLLARHHHEVVPFYPGPDWRVVLEKVLRGGFDLALCWQQEFYAPPLLAAGLRTVVAPMFDACHERTDRYWSHFHAASFLNFSSALHSRLTGLGLSSFFARYFPAPTSGPAPDFSRLRGFLWQRTSAIDWRTLRALVGDQLDTLHVHLAPDELGAPPPDTIALRQAFPSLTLSTWSADRSAYAQALAQANFYLAPRLSEGIGHSFLEAMARGQCVLAHARPTHSEYITSGRDGLLADFLHPAPVSLAAASSLGAEARATVARGRAEWEAAEAPLLAWLAAAASAPAPRLAPATRDLAPEFPRLYWTGLLR